MSNLNKKTTTCISEWSLTLVLAQLVMIYDPDGISGRINGGPHKFKQIIDVVNQKEIIPSHFNKHKLFTAQLELGLTLY